MTGDSQGLAGLSEAQGPPGVPEGSLLGGGDMVVGAFDKGHCASRCVEVGQRITANSLVLECSTPGSVAVNQGWEALDRDISGTEEWSSSGRRGGRWRA